MTLPVNGVAEMARPYEPRICMPSFGEYRPVSEYGVPRKLMPVVKAISPPAANLPSNEPSTVKPFHVPGEAAQAEMIGIRAQPEAYHRAGIVPFRDRYRAARQRDRIEIRRDREIRGHEVLAQEGVKIPLLACQSTPAKDQVIDLVGRGVLQRRIERDGRRENPPDAAAATADPCGRVK